MFVSGNALSVVCVLLSLNINFENFKGNINIFFFFAHPHLNINVVSGWLWKLLVEPCWMWTDWLNDRIPTAGVCQETTLLSKSLLFNSEVLVVDCAVVEWVLCLVHLHNIIIILTLWAEVVLDHIWQPLLLDHALSIIIAPSCTVTWGHVMESLEGGWEWAIPGRDKQQSPVSQWLHGAYRLQDTRMSKDRHISWLWVRNDGCSLFKGLWHIN